MIPLLVWIATQKQVPDGQRGWAANAAVRDLTPVEATPSPTHLPRRWTYL
jgi:hypothetical protein